jgi:hypothetical protein
VKKETDDDILLLGPVDDEGGASGGDVVMVDDDATCTFDEFNVVVVVGEGRDWSLLLSFMGKIEKEGACVNDDVAGDDGEDRLQKELKRGNGGRMPKIRLPLLLLLLLLIPAPEFAQPVEDVVAGVVIVAG